jgi:hypothetical protein
MNVKEHLLQMLSHDNWANRECLSALCSASPAPPNAIRFIAHTLSAQKLWLERLRKQPQTMPVWPAATIEDCSALAQEMLSAWKNYLLGCPPGWNEIDIATAKGALVEPRAGRHARLAALVVSSGPGQQKWAAGLQPFTPTSATPFATDLSRVGALRPDFGWRSATLR